MSEQESRRWPRRRRANAEGARSHRVVIKHTDDEYAEVCRLAELAGVSPARLYVRALRTGSAEGVVAVQALRDDLAGARRLLAAVSRNLNQLTVSVHIGEQVGTDLTATLDAVRRSIARIERVTEEIDRAEAGR